MDITKMERLLLESLFARKRVHRRWTERHTISELNWPDSAGSTENTGENCYYPSLVFVMQGLMNSHGQELSSEDCDAVI